MPSSYSKKRKRSGNCEKDGDKSKTQKSGSTSSIMKRTESQASFWNSALGKSIPVIPQLQLPTIRRALRRFRFLRIEHTNSPTFQLAGQIAKEVMVIGDKARIPTVSLKGCTDRIVNTVEMWYQHKNKPEKRETTEFQQKLDALLDLKPKSSWKGRRRGERIGVS